MSQLNLVACLSVMRFPLIYEVSSVKFHSRCCSYFFLPLSHSFLNRRKNIKPFLRLPQIAHMVDLHLFLGRPLKLVGKDSQAQDDGLIGAVPQLLVDEEQNFLKRAHDQSHDLVSQINNDYSMNVRYL